MFRRNQYADIDSRNSHYDCSSADESLFEFTKKSISELHQTLIQYPKSIGFIISNEFCERFNYYGMRTILVLYLTSKLHYDDDTATVLFHIFTMLVYLFPLIGAIIADSWLGKFKTILYLSLVYAIGGVIVALGAVPILHLPVKEITILGLTLIAIGTGGIKPCVSAFGGDQFRLPEQAAQLATFFSLFYFAINAGSMISTSITPILRQDVHCFGDSDCFPLAFGVPALLMLLSVIIFLAGRKLYVMKAPSGNMIFNVSKCITEAIKCWRQERHINERKHWLDYAEPSCGYKMVEDTKTLMKILILYFPFPVFWALFDQQGSRWTFQATRMDGELWGFTIKPDQMQVINPLLILGFIPLFDYILYPLLAKLGIKRPLQKLAMGGLLAAVAFIFSALLEFKLEQIEPLPIGPMHGQLRIYNGMPCSYRFHTEIPTIERSFVIDKLALFEEKDLIVPQPLNYTYRAISSSGKCSDMRGTIKLLPGKPMSYFMVDGKMLEFEDSLQKSKLGIPLIRVLVNLPPSIDDDDDNRIELVDNSKVPTCLNNLNTSQVIQVQRGEIAARINNKVIGTFSVQGGGVYTMILAGSQQDGFETVSYTLTAPNEIHMLWQLPQIIVITAAEIMFSVTGLEFSFTQAPQSMKSVLQACWLLSVAIGNMLVVVVAELKFFNSQAAEFALFAGLMIVDILLFMILAHRYEYVDYCADAETADTAKQIECASKAISNEAFVEEH